MTFRAAFVLCGSLLLSVSSRVCALTVNELLNQMEIQEAQTQSLKFNYEQETKFLAQGPKATARGTALVQKPSKIRLEQSFPDVRWTISDGKKTWIYTPEEKQAWLSKNAKMDGLAKMNIFPLENMAATLRKNYSLSIVSESTGAAKTIHVSARPKSPDDDGRLDFVFSIEDWIPRSTRYRSSTADIVTKISHVELRPELKGSEFQFVPPKGTDVLSF